MKDPKKKGVWTIYIDDVVKTPNMIKIQQTIQELHEQV